MRAQLSVNDILDLLIHSTPLFRLYINYNRNINSRFKIYSNLLQIKNMNVH